MSDSHAEAVSMALRHAEKAKNSIRWFIYHTELVGSSRRRRDFRHPQLWQEYRIVGHDNTWKATAGGLSDVGQLISCGPLHVVLADVEVFDSVNDHPGS